MEILAMQNFGGSGIIFADFFHLVEEGLKIVNEFIWEWAFVRSWKWAPGLYEQPCPTPGAVLYCLLFWMYIHWVGLLVA